VVILGARTGREWMMINHASRHIGVQPLQRRKALSIHQDDTFHDLVRNLVGPDERQLIPVEGQEAAQVAVGASREYGERLRIQFRCPKKRG
jgi:hypothetical protein